MVDTIIVMAGGMYSRMKKSESDDLDDSKSEQANKTSKSLITFGKNNTPFIYFLLKNISNAGFKNVVLVVSKDYKNFKNSIDNFYSELNLNISYATQHIPNDRQKPMGTADAVFQALEQNEKLKESFFCVCNSDNLYSEEALKLIRGNDYENAFLSYDRDSLDFPKERVSSFSVVKLDHKNNLKAIIEKPTIEQVNNNLDKEGKVRVNMNLFKFSALKFFRFLAECPFDPVRNEKELPTAMINMIESKESYVKGIPIAEHVPDLTSKSDIITISKFFE